MNTEEINAKCHDVRHAHNIQFDLKEEQLTIVEAAMNGRHTIGLLPTGYGKTMCFVVPAMVYEEDSITLIISPLKSLMDDQIDQLTKMNFRCVKITAKDDMTQEQVTGSESNMYDTFSVKYIIAKYHYACPISMYLYAAGR